MAVAEGIDGVTVEGAGKRATVSGKALHRLLNVAPEASYPAPQKAQFETEEGTVDFIEAPDLADIGNRLIETCEEFAHLR